MFFGSKLFLRLGIRWQGGVLRGSTRSLEALADLLSALMPTEPRP